MELKDLIGWVFCCFLALSLGGSAVLGLLGYLLYRTTGHIVKSDARSREMVMSLSDDWRSYRKDEHDAAMAPPEAPAAPVPPWRNPSMGDGFPEEMMPPAPPGHMG